ncbi:CHAT domain-containing protein [Aspergillus cavernicola]|uniref:CHAT domain-containing protein n=1 Tax=Aspergillus cavernicola TaxID=176166 RepID=A0ABR4HPC9_9EURO
MADTAIEEMQSILDENGLQTVVTSGSAVTQGALREQFTDADLLHLHGHTAGHDLERHLVLEREGRSASSRSPVSAAQYTARTGISPFLSLSEVQQASQERMQRFTLQDAFAVTVRARLVMLMGCGSGIQVIREGDDALGLVNAFLSAGATSVMSTLWPLDQTDAANFSKEFYRNMFASADDVIDLATAFQSSVNLMRACRRPGCQRKRPSARLQCHRVAPYHWAPFTLSGSWVCQGIAARTRDEMLPATPI